MASEPASRLRSNLTLAAVRRSSLAGNPANSSTGKLWPMFQSPFQLPDRFQSAGGVVRTCRKTRPCRISAVQVPWMSVWADAGVADATSSNNPNVLSDRNMQSSRSRGLDERIVKKVERSNARLKPSRSGSFGDVAARDGFCRRTFLRGERDGFSRAVGPLGGFDRG